MKSNKSHSDPVLRIDKWLWAARFYKTRSLAAQAVSGGKVHLNQSRVKPSRALKPGDRLQIKKSDLSWDVEVLGLSSQRGPAKQAVLLYQESAESIAERETQQGNNRVLYQALPKPGRKPDKRERRQWSKLEDKAYED
ncbi:MAG: RNA-binding protein [Gammaproteobacteria bacterium]|nr:RNA-binding protein [Gammaproteobacteria bacterium]